MDKQPTLARVVVPRASEALAEQIRNLIVAGSFQPGQMLPAERDLIVETGLSRTTVRDALRILESRGLIVTRPGRAGGSMVTLPGRDSISRSVELFVRTHGITLSSLLECRVAVEPALARLAALHRTEAQLDEMNRIHEAFVASVGDVARYKAINLDWHLAIARASRNEPLMALVEAITTPIREAMDYQDVTTPEIRALAVKSHGAIMQAIREQDGDAAFNRMNRHVSAYRDISAQRLGPAA